jgi:hypothetical protein
MVPFDRMYGAVRWEILATTPQLSLPGLTRQSIFQLTGDLASGTMDPRIKSAGDR